MSETKADTTPTFFRRRGGLAVAALVLLVGVLIATCLGMASRSTTTALGGSGLRHILTEAERANAAHDLWEETALLLRAENLDGSPEDTQEVQRRLALLDWKYHHRFDEARGRLLRSATESSGAFETWLAIARLEQARQRFGEAASASRKARDLATSEVDEDRSRVALARATVARSVEVRLAGGDGSSDALRDSFVDLREMVSRAPGRLEPSRLLLQIALILEEHETALAAWRSYFHVSPRDPGPNLVAAAGSKLEGLQQDWTDSNQARIDLALALSSSRLFTEAALVVLAPSASEEVRQEPRADSIVHYLRFTRKARTLTEEHYRQAILGNDTRASWQAALRAALEPMAIVLADCQIASRSFPVDPGRTGSLDQAVLQRIASCFGAYISIGTTAGYFDLHMGHFVSDEARTVEQYGRRADLRLIVLDNMISNGFQSWAWESGAQHGGWNKPYGIFQVRPAYVGGGLRAWRRLHSRDELSEFLDEMARESKLDEHRALLDPFAYLPGLAMRLEYQGQTRLLEELESRGLRGEALRLAFLAAYDDAILESSIFAHEGRHAIDERHSSLLRFLRNREFSAKLSEVALAPRPRLSLDSIISPNIGDKTPHGKANLKIMKGLVAWMDRHRGEIAGLDGDSPMLPQADLLSEEQLREAFRSMDRLAGRE